LGVFLVAGARSGAEGTGSVPVSLGAVGTIDARLGDVRACYEAASVRKPWLAGRVVVSFTLELTGHPGRVEIERSDIDDVRFLACVQEAMRGWILQRPVGITQPTDVSYPFVFAGKGKGDPSVLVDGRPRPVTLPARCRLPAECRALGEGLAFGSGVDQQRAFAYFETGCTLKDAVSCAGAAAALDFGRGVTKDKRRAFALAERGCALGSKRACTSVAMSHALGAPGAPKKDPAKGAVLLERACAGGDGGACLDLAERRRLGVGVARDEAAAAELRRRALERAD
jgi:TPR repeat protein